MHSINGYEKNQIDIYSFFHPIISIKDRSIIAMEALSRYRNNENEALRSISELFDSLENEEQLLELDLFLISHAINSFKEYLSKDDKTLLFINVTSQIIKNGEAGVFMICNLLEKYSISPRRIVLEILEDDLDDSRECMDFFHYCKEEEFLLALDDVGVGYSNLQRIAQVKPDIIKLDITLVSNHQNDYYKKKVIESLINLAHDIGAIVVAEGVESLEETLSSLLLGAGLVQGYYFCRPQPIIPEIVNECIEKIEKCRNELKYHKKIRQNKISNVIREYQKVVNSLVELLSAVSSDAFEEILHSCLLENVNIECLFILDKDGIQFSNSVYKYKNHKKHFLFQPADKKSDHSLKPYFLDPEGIHSNNITNPYISQASGNTCLTFSSKFANKEDQYILCVDYYDFLDAPYQNKNVSLLRA